LRERFQGILELQDLRGVALFSRDGIVLFEDWRGAPSPLGSAAAAFPLVTTILEGHPGAEVTFTRGRVCLRDTALGPLVAVAGPSAPAAMVRLQLDLVVPTLANKPAKKGFLGLFGSP